MTTPEVEIEKWVPDMTFGARLALVRHRMGWNVKEAATACGLPAQSWRGWEVDGREPHRLITVAMAIASRTGVDLDWLVYGPNGKVAAPNGRYGEQTVIARIAPSAEGSSVWSERQSVGPNGWDRPVRQTRPILRDTRRPHKALAR